MKKFILSFYDVAIYMYGAETEIGMIKNRVQLYQYNGKTPSIQKIAEWIIKSSLNAGMLASNSAHEDVCTFAECMNSYLKQSERYISPEDFHSLKGDDECE